MTAKLPALLLATVVAAGTLTAKRANANESFVTASLGFSFDKTNPLAQEWAKTQSGRLVADVSDETRGAIRAVVEQAFRDGLPPKRAARLIQPLVGLTKPQARALVNLEARLHAAAPGDLVMAGKVRIRVPASGLTLERIASATRQYAERLHRQRALAIARTETMGASNEGQRQAWLQAKQKGLLKGNERREWITTPDDRLCPICEPMDGQTRGLTEAFVVPGIGTVMGPPAHTLCRCTTGLTTRGAPKVDRVLSPDDADVRDTWTFFERDGGEWANARARLHDTILEDMLAGIAPSENPTVYMTGGGPASGKSTMLNSGKVAVPPKTHAAHVDADAIKARLPEYQAMVAAKDPRAANFVHEESSYLGKRISEEAAKRGLDVVVDTTGNSTYDNLAEKVSRLRGNTHRVVAHYASNDTDFALELARLRGEKTGCVVPEAYIKRVHASVSKVLPQAVRHDLFDEVDLFDTNLKDQPRLVMRARRGEPVEIVDADLWQAFLDKATKR